MNGIIVSSEINKDELEEFLKDTQFKSTVPILDYINKVCQNAEFIIFRNESIIYGLSIIYVNKLEVGFAYITYIAISQEYRGKGLAKKLLSDTCLLAQKRGFRYVRLEVKKSNSTAFQLYNRMNFRVIDENETSYFMERELYISR